MAEKRTYESIKYNYNPDEVRLLGEQLARETQIIFDLETEKKTAVSAFTAQLKAAAQRIADLASKVNNGYELREVECLVMLEDPRPGQKRIVRMDTNETIRIEPMSMMEMQGSFGFGESAE